MAFSVLWLAAFAVGGVVMVLEITGARLLAPTYGASTVPWTAVIACVLLGVALGNAWGGRRSRRPGNPLPILLAGAAASVLLPLLRGDLPDLLFRQLGMAGGATAVSLLLFLPGAFLLGAAVPLLVRLGTRRLDEVGRKTGLLNGANALGAIVGTLVTGFVLIPAVPVSRILAAAGVLLLLLAGGLALLGRGGSPRKEGGP